jgi:hypothetical protein
MKALRSGERGSSGQRGAASGHFPVRAMVCPERGLMLQNERIAELPSPHNLVRLPNAALTCAGDGEPKA